MDGIEVQIPKDKEEVYFKVCKQWEEITKYTLEYDKYKQMFIKNVNNYHAIYESGKIKRKGCFETYQDIISLGDYHKNTSMNIIPLALNEYLVNGTQIEEFIINHKDIFDFFIGEGSESSPVKGKPVFLLTGENENKINIFKIIESRFLRYYASEGNNSKVKKYTLSKEYKDLSKTNLHSDTKVAICEKLNKNYKIENFDVNYTWYINETYKILNNGK